ncbi:MAG: peptidoglycan-binding domain-containing protein [Cypionkella sp.]
MLPLVSNLKTKLIAGSVAVALLATSAAPALAWSRDDKMFTRGVATTLLLGYLVTNSNNQHNTRQAPVYRQQPVYRSEPVYRERTRNPGYYGHDDDRRYDRRYDRPQVYVAPQSSVYSTPAAYAFSGYSSNERRRIQATLTNYGYYNGALDGSFGPGTYAAISNYARNTGRTQFLGTQAGASEIFDALLG